MRGLPIRKRGSGGYVTVWTVVALVGSMAATVAGLGAANRALSVQDASSWLWSARKGEVARVNAVNGRVDTRHRLVDSQGHTVQVSQTDTNLILRDLTTGKVSALDLATLQVSGRLPTTPGKDISIALNGSHAFVVDSVQGTVAQVDPVTLRTSGQVLSFPPGISRGAFDNDGALWIAVPDQGTVVAIRPGEKGAGPRVDRTVGITDPHHELVVSVLDKGIAVLDQTSATLITFRGDDPRRTPVPAANPGTLPTHSPGSTIPVTVVQDRHVYVVSGERVRPDFEVPGGDEISAAVAYGGRYYVADEAARRIWVYDGTGRAVKPIDITAAYGPVELEVREGHLFVNAPNSNAAWVVDAKGSTRLVDKYADNILGGDKPKVPPVVHNPVKDKPRAGPPAAPRSVAATAGNASVRVSWGTAAPNGSPVTKYVVEGAGKPVTVGARQRTLDVTGLDNGTQYQFSVHAVNANGPGPARRSNPVVPTADVPDPPVRATATAQPDGTVSVSWPAADGQGQKIVRYEVTAISSTGQQVIAQSTATSARVKAGPSTELDYGKAYTFSVAAVGNRGASSRPSPPSASVTPFTRPGKPSSVEAATVQGKAGTITVSWGDTADNGSAITRFTVKVGDRIEHPVAGVHSWPIDRLGNGASVKVSVAAENKAGIGDPATTTAKTVAVPSVTILSISAGANDLTVKVRAEDGGGKVTCTMTVTGKAGGNDSGPCTTFSLGHIPAGQQYTVQVKAANAAGTSKPDTAKVTTDKLSGTVRCVGPAGDDYCNGIPPRKPGIGVYSTTSQDPGAWAYQRMNGFRTVGVCKRPGDSINSKFYNGNKVSSWWVRFEDGKYIPFAWFNLDGADKDWQLAEC